MSDRQAIVVGAGAAGLAAAAQLKRNGVDALVLERSDAVGSSWRGRYDRLKLNTSTFTSKLPRSRFPRGCGMFPARDVVVRYLEDYARSNGLHVRFGSEVTRIDRDGGGWALSASDGSVAAPQVVVATGYEHTPVIPDWPGRDRFGGRLLHAAEYRNATPFAGETVLVVGPGCSGMEIAYDLADGGAGRVQLAVRTPPNIVLRRAGPLPGDAVGIAMLRLPPAIADAQMRFVRRRILGDLSEFGLPVPADGLFTRLRREGKAPAIVDPEVIEAIKARRIEVVAGVESLDHTGVTLADGTRSEPDAVISATGYSRALDPMVGHLGVLDERGVPRVRGAKPALPGLRFIGYVPRPGQIGYMGAEATRAARAIARELRAHAPQLQPAG